MKWTILEIKRADTIGPVRKFTRSKVAMEFNEDLSELFTKLTTSAGLKSLDHMMDAFYE